MSTTLLGIDLDQSQFVPHALNEVVQAMLHQFKDRITRAHLLQVHLTADNHCVWLSGEFVHLLQADRVDLVVHICNPLVTTGID